MPIVDSKTVAVKAVASKAVISKAVDVKSVQGNSMLCMHAPISEKELRARLAQNLRRHRASQGISQEGLAALAGLHRTFVSQVERELKNLSLDSISRLANALKVDPSDLLKA
jgi:DNA-binding XRE family transcriptional regulator